MKKIRFIAEISSNHNQDLERCLRFIEVAANIGCDAVKFQLFKIEELFAKEILVKSPTHREREHWQLPLDFLPSIHQSCKEHAIDFICTPFYLEAVEQLFPYVAGFKVSSYELTWPTLLKKVAATHKPVLLSTGMAHLQEVQHAVDTLITNGCENLSLLHCVSCYPVPIKECNLAAIEAMRCIFSDNYQGCMTQYGWSDHSVEPSVIYRAVHKWQAEVIEFHLDLDGLGVEFHNGHCWQPELAAQMISTVNDGLLSDGKLTKEPAQSETKDIPWRADPQDGLRPTVAVRAKF